MHHTTYQKSEVGCFTVFSSLQLVSFFDLPLFDSCPGWMTPPFLGSVGQAHVSSSEVVGGGQADAGVVWKSPKAEPVEGGGQAWIVIRKRTSWLTNHVVWQRKWSDGGGMPSKAGIVLCRSSQCIAIQCQCVLWGINRLVSNIQPVMAANSVIGAT